MIASLLIAAAGITATQDQTIRVIPAVPEEHRYHLSNEDFAALCRTLDRKPDPKMKNWPCPKVTSVKVIWDGDKEQCLKETHHIYNDEYVACTKPVIVELYQDTTHRKSTP